MQIITKGELEDQKKQYVEAIQGGAVFIYPTDTIYGLGCDATNEAAVARLRGLKKKPEGPMSVIAPSKQWVKESCYIDNNEIEWLAKLPGPCTLIMRLRNPEAVSGNVNDNGNTLGIRIPDNWFSQLVAELGIPIISTSVNITGGSFMTEMEDLNSSIKESVDFIIYEGKLAGTPSKIVDLTKKEVKIIER